MSISVVELEVLVITTQPIMLAVVAVVAHLLRTELVTASVVEMAIPIQVVAELESAALGKILTEWAAEMDALAELVVAL